MGPGGGSLLRPGYFGGCEYLLYSAIDARGSGLKR